MKKIINTLLALAMGLSFNAYSQGDCSLPANFIRVGLGSTYSKTSNLAGTCINNPCTGQQNDSVCRIAKQAARRKADQRCSTRPGCDPNESCYSIFVGAAAACTYYCLDLNGDTTHECSALFTQTYNCQCELKSERQCSVSPPQGTLSPGGTITLHLTTNIPNPEIQWFHNDTAIYGATQSILVAVDTGYYDVEVISQNDSISALSNQVYIGATVSIIPTVSQWGLIIMILLMIAVMFIMRRRLRIA